MIQWKMIVRLDETVSALLPLFSDSWKEWGFHELFIFSCG